MEMNRRDLETLLLTLESTPALLARAAARVSAEQAREPGPAGTFALIEHAWHLADLEREAYGVRIRRLLTEEEPMLSNFDGERVARERAYRTRDLGEGLAAFTTAREANLARLRTLSPSDWKRQGFQESVGRIALADVPRMMAEHDRIHEQEIAELIAHLQGAPHVERRSPRSAVA
jgi:hypothetical protein